MAYQILYGQTMIKTSFKEKKRLHFSKKQSIILLSCVLLVFLALLSQWKPFQDALLPGNSDITRNAITNMITELQAGESLGDVIPAFCQEIVDGAQISK